MVKEKKPSLEKNEDGSELIRDMGEHIRKTVRYMGRRQKADPFVVGEETYLQGTVGVRKFRTIYFRLVPVNTSKHQPLP
jgi:hypothetical protein